MSNESLLNVGVIGLGLGYAVHCEVYKKNPQVKLLAICDHDKQWLDYCNSKLNVENTYTDYKELLSNKDIEAVSICLPTYLHAEATIAALEAGKHVLCEKPMAVTPVEAEAMHDAAQRSGKKLMISHNQRFGTDAVLLKQLIDSGMFGEIYLIRTGWRRPLGMIPGPMTTRENGTVSNRNWFNEKDKGGGVLRDLGSHLVDLAMYLTDFPKFVEAAGNCYRKFYPDGFDQNSYEFILDAEDLAVGHLKFENGMSIQLEVSFGSHIESDVVFTEIYGTKAGASRRNGVVKIFKYDNGISSVETLEHINIPVKPPMDWFVDCILDKTEPKVTSAQGVEIIKILDAIYTSAGEIK